MDVETIEVPKEKARTALREYRDAIKVDIANRRTKLRAEDEALAAGYRELAKGRNLLELQAAMAAAGVNEHRMPTIAIARADARWCYLDWSSRWNGARMTNSDVDWFAFGSGEVPHRIRTADRRFTWLDVPDGIAKPDADSWSGSVRTQVPIVPPALRPRGSLERYHVLFEVEAWERIPPPPRDPLLLKRIRGDLFAIVAEWELTELERAVMGTRR